MDRLLRWVCLLSSFCGGGSFDEEVLDLRAIGAGRETSAEREVAFDYVRSKKCMNATARSAVMTLHSVVNPDLTPRKWSVRALPGWAFADMGTSKSPNVGTSLDNVLFEHVNSFLQRHQSQRDNTTADTQRFIVLLFWRDIQASAKSRTSRKISVI